MSLVSSVPEFVEASVKKNIDLWNNTISDLNHLDLPDVVTDCDEDNYTNELMDDVIGKFRKKERPDKKSLKYLFSSVLRCEPGVILSKEYKAATIDFIGKARNTDPSINLNDIYQAIRNFWIANSIQHLFGEEIKFTVPLFAYSMLYPYTDNYLDDSEINASDKKQFNDRLRQRLSGVELIPKDPYEEKIFRMVGLIEQNYHRSEFPQVYDSLLAIHAAQEKSIFLNSGKCDNRSTVSISFEKGGTSVLADGYLAMGSLTYDQADFLMGFGIFLQLLDDLQDLTEDNLQHHNTIFANLLGQVLLDQTVVRLIDFMLKTLTFGEELHPDKKGFFKVIRNSCMLLATRSIYMNKSYFSQEFIDFIGKKTGYPMKLYLIHKSKMGKLSRRDIEHYFNDLFKGNYSLETIIN